MNTLKTWLMGFPEYLDAEEASVAEMAMVLVELNKRKPAKQVTEDVDDGEF